MHSCVRHDEQPVAQQSRHVEERVFAADRFQLPRGPSLRRGGNENGLGAVSGGFDGECVRVVQQQQYSCKSIGIAF